MQGGDTLESIAYRHLGSKTRWPDIVSLNPGLEPKRLFEGQEIYQIPGNVQPVQTRTIVDPRYGAKLTGKVGKASIGMFLANDEDAPETQDFTGRVIQGSRELSNVSAVEELVAMLVGMRHYEASQRALRSISEAVAQNTNPQG